MYYEVLAIEYYRVAAAQASLSLLAITAAILSIITCSRFCELFFCPFFSKFPSIASKGLIDHRCGINTICDGLTTRILQMFGLLSDFTIISCTKPYGRHVILNLLGPVECLTITLRSGIHSRFLFRIQEHCRHSQSFPYRRNCMQYVATIEHTQHTSNGIFNYFRG